MALISHTSLCSLRCQVPRTLLKDGYEPGEVKSDGNCFFHSIAWAINLDNASDCHDLSCLLRLRAVVCGATQMDWFLSKVLPNACIKNLLSK